MAKKKQVGIYLQPEVFEALRLFAFKKRVSHSQVVERALERCIPESYFALKILNRRIPVSAFFYTRKPS